MTNVSTATRAAAGSAVRFLRTPKGLLVIIFVGLLALSVITLDSVVITSRVIVAAAVGAGIDLPLNYWRRRRWILPGGAVLTAVIVAFILRTQEPWFVLVVTVAIAIISKHALRTRWSNILNPAAFALVVAAILLNTGQDWWGALPDLGIAGAVVILVAGVFIADRINKLSMILAFFGTYYALFAFASLFRSTAVAETFVTPDLQAVLFFGFFMLDDPPTSPVRHEDQIIFGIIVAAVAYLVFMQFGGVYFLPAGLLAGNVWESGRRLVIGRMRTRGTATAGGSGGRRLPVAGGLGIAMVGILLVLASGIIVTSGVSVGRSANAVAASDASPRGAAAAAPGPSAVADKPNPYPFVPSFDSDFKGNYTQTNDGTNARLSVDGLAAGDLSLGVHVELVQVSVVPPPDDESAESVPDDEVLEARPKVTTTTNTAQLLDPASSGLLCDGKLTGLSGGDMRFICNGTAAYTGVRMQIESQLDVANDGTVSGALSGTMQHTS